MLTTCKTTICLLLNQSQLQVFHIWGCLLTSMGCGDGWPKLSLDTVREDTMRKSNKCRSPEKYSCVIVASQQSWTWHREPTHLAAASTCHCDVWSYQVRTACTEAHAQHCQSQQNSHSHLSCAAERCYKTHTRRYRCTCVCAGDRWA